MALPRFATLSWGRSIKRRLVLLFLLLALALAGVFIFAAQRAFSTGWREAARPLINDYVDRLAADITDTAAPGQTATGQAPNIERAKFIVARLPITVRIDGPRTQWTSHPERGARHPAQPNLKGSDWAPLLSRTTADGHRITFGIDESAFERRRREFGAGLVALLLITLAAYLVVRRLLRPLDDIRAGVERFGAGDFAIPIPVRHAQRPDELGQLASSVNTMAHDIAQMLEAKRALLLAISHELRSPLTRARLHVELLPEDAPTLPHRQALLRDVQEMSSLVSDLLESERLAEPHATLNREPTDLAALVAEVLEELHPRHASAAAITLNVAPDLGKLSLDRARMRLLLRNLLDNALRHGAGAAQAPALSVVADGSGGAIIIVRDHGPGVAPEQLPHLTTAFYRPDSARTRAAGGVGLGLYLCRLVAQAHGGQLTLTNAEPGLRATVNLPRV